MPPRRRRRPGLLGLLLLLASAGPTGAMEIPASLPHYDLDICLDVAGHVAVVTERVTWTNPCDRPAAELVFNVHSHFKLPGKDVGFTAKMLEILRVTPSDALDTQGRCCDLRRVTLPGGPPGADQPVVLSPRWENAQLPKDPQAAADPQVLEDTKTALVVPLPTPVGRGESVTVQLEFTLRLPQKQGRWGQWQGVTFLSNWHPVLAFYDDQGWQPTPFIPWHQPFFNEAGRYTARVTLPCQQKFGCTGTVLAVTDLGDGRKRADIAAAAARDFAFLCSERFAEFTGQVDGVHVRCLAFPEHEYHARKMVGHVCEAIPVYSHWFGPYAYPEFTIVESYFGWNGNECAGLVMIDERVFGMPHMAAGYVEYLITHELCHQWWYNAVGTNGYCETWMDEGLATYFSHRVMTLKHGRRNSDMLEFPRGLEWLPNIERDTYRNYGLYGTQGRGELGPTVQPMEDFGHVINLFSMCYDRGSKIVGMIEDRLGEAAFFDFMRVVYRRYYFRVLRVADFRRELEMYTGYSWEEFFRDWLYGKGATDWSVEKVHVDEITTDPSRWRQWRNLWHRAVAPVPCQVTVTLRQKADYNEQTVVGFSFDGTENYQVRIPILPAVPELRLDDPPAVVTWLPENRVRVEVVLPQRPTQIAVDPDQVLFDREPANNFWKPRCRVRVTPLYTLLDETDITAAYDRLNLTIGPWLYGTAYDEQWYTRSMMAGVRAGVYRTQQFNAGVYAAYRSDYRDVAVGADALWDHWPYSHTQIGFNAERSLASMDDSHFNNRGVVFGRYVFTYGSSLYLPAIQYLEAFGAIENNQLPVPRCPQPDAHELNNMTLLGLHYRLDYLTPYWDPEGGFRVDVTAANGVAAFGQNEDFNRISGQVSVVKGLPDGLGWLSDTRVAARAYGAAGWPNNGLYFTLGGAGLFRGFDMAERQGSAVWLGSVEWRVPLLKHLTWDCCDHAAGLRGISAVAFYDVGNAYVNGHAACGDVAHGVGAGVYFDVAWFSFVERTTIRFDVAKSINAPTPFQFNFYFQHPF
jgi:hypothetical protein